MSVTVELKRDGNDDYVPPAYPMREMKFGTFAVVVSTGEVVYRGSRLRNNHIVQILGRDDSYATDLKFVSEIPVRDLADDEYIIIRNG